MRSIKREKIVMAVKDLYISENYDIRNDYLEALKKAQETEESPLAKEIIKQMLENFRIAKEERMPMCQDTGFSIYFVELGRDIHLDFDLYEAINEGVRQGCKEGFLRASIVKNPINRVNTGDNTPAVIHIELTPGDKVTIHALAKGGGSENKSKLYMLKPNDGVEGVKKAVLEAVSLAGPDACPPYVVGVGIGGTSDKAMELAKRVLIREIGSKNKDTDLGKLENELLEEINKLGIGPAGMGGRTTALAVFVDIYPCHIASLPLAINIQCNADRYKCVTI